MSHAISVDAHTRIENLYILPKIILDMLNLSGGSHLLFMDFFLTCILKNRSLPLHLQLKEEELQIFQKHSELFSQAPQLLAPLFQIYQSNLFVNLLLLLCDNWIRPALSSREPSLSRELRILQLIYKNIQLPVSQIIQWIADDLELNPQYLNRIVKNSFHTPLSELRILQLIYKNIQLPVSQIIQWIADDLELNPQYLNRIVKNSFHTPLSHLILETKLEKSCQFLEENSTITETALALGFYDHSHYTRYFTRYFGISPLILETKLEKSCQFLEENSTITETALALGFYDHSHYTRYFTRYFGISPSSYQKKYLKV